MARRVTYCLGLLLLVVTVGCSGDTDYERTFELPEDARENEKLTLKFGRVPSETVTGLLRQNAPLIRLLKDELDVNITYRFADDYRGIIEGMESETYDFTWMGPYSYVLSECSSDTGAAYQPLVRPMRRNQNGNVSGEYRGIIIARPNRGIEEIQDLRGRSFAFVEERSTSGYLFPLASLIDAGIEPETDFSSYDFLSRHDRVVQSVLDGSHDAGAVYNDARMQEFDSRNRAERQLPVLTETRPIPTSPITVSEAFADNHPDLVDKFVEVMTSLHENKRGRSILETLGIERYRRANDEDYGEVRNVVDTLGDRLPEVKSLCRGAFD